MKKGSGPIRAEVTFAEYKAARIAGTYGEDKTQDEVLMLMFKDRGIKLDDEGKPKRPAIIETDKANEKFVLIQG
ncbi:hypothetical protein [Herminiimonas contaminans]|uniref:Uncharacterized protein n=1 Tax=Herminiimonas contaminans TaxID=1111140 RepID=A0ABS0ESY3_9BURK|nr:hypothetical protein [Herminiimonas contaminans]MBF8177830.1 hypothetical protein [Herminiimonas contaminans]